MQLEIIAEIAQGFEGCKEQARLLVQAAASSGANSVKFQLVYADELATPDYEYYKLFSDLEMHDEDWIKIKSTCDSYNVELILDIFGKKSLALAELLNLKTIKVHATDINIISFLENISSSSIERVLLGAGGAVKKELKKAVDILNSKKIVLLHGFQGYPTPLESNQLSRIHQFRKIFKGIENVSIGLSDHIDPDSSTSISLPSFAFGMGVKVIEKHLTLGKCMKMEDYESALNPDQFEIFVNSMRDINTSFGQSKPDEDFGMTDSELDYRVAIRRHVVTTKKIEKGDKITTDAVTLKRTSSQNTAHDISVFFNQTSNKALDKNKAITIEDIQK